MHQYLALLSWFSNTNGRIKILLFVLENQQKKLVFMVWDTDKIAFFLPILLKGWLLVDLTQVKLMVSCKLLLFSLTI